MKVVINTCFGGFGINPEVAMQYFGDKFFEPKRTNTTLIKLIESGINCNDSGTKLKVVDIPEEATDWRIIEHNGAEYILYVVNGKMHSIY